jgi:lipoprotein-anchoring transpeptidase ErfK/SrfK
LPSSSFSPACSASGTPSASPHFSSGQRPLPRPRLRLRSRAPLPAIPLPSWSRVGPRIDGSAGPADLKLLARCHRSLGHADEEKAAWQRILDAHPKDPCGAEALCGLGTLAQEQGRPDEAAAFFAKALEGTPAAEASVRAGTALGDFHRSKGERGKAARAYTRALAGAAGGERDRIKKALAELQAEIFFAGEPGEEIALHTVQPGDSLAKIAIANHTTPGMIRLVNRLQGNVIHPGQQLRIPKGELRLEVVKSRFLLAVYVGDIWFKEYSVGIGKDNATPETEFEIDTKIENPPWHWNGRIIPPEDPENILGTRWMGFKKKPGLQGFGIHGARDPSSVPGAVSKGCIRMKNEEVEDLFELVPRGAKVVIRP